MEPEARFKIDELAGATGLSRRTIHHYIAEGLIPRAKGGAGPAAYYDEEHYLRLRLLTRLKDMGLSLSTIRDLLDDLSLEEMREVVDLPGELDYRAIWGHLAMMRSEGADRGPGIHVEAARAAASPPAGRRFFRDRRSREPEGAQDLALFLSPPEGWDDDASTIRRDASFVNRLTAERASVEAESSPSRSVTPRVSRFLVEAGLIEEEDLRRARQEASARGDRLEHYLVTNNLVSEEDLVRLISERYEVPMVELDDLDVPDSVIDLVPVDIVYRYHVFPIDLERNVLKVAMADPTDVVAIDDLKFVTGLRIQPVVASERAIADAIDIAYADAYAEYHERAALMFTLEPTSPDGIEFEREGEPLHAGFDSQPWHRVRVSSDLEISYRESPDPLTRKKLRQLLEFVRRLFRLEISVETYDPDRAAGAPRRSQGIRERQRERQQEEED